MQETEDIVTRLQFFGRFGHETEQQAAVRRIEERREAATTIATLRAEVEGLRKALESIVAIEDREWKPVQCFRSDEQVARDEIRHELAIEIAEIARAAIDAAKAGKEAA